MKNNKVKIALFICCCAAIAFEAWHFRSAPRSARQLPSLASQKDKRNIVLLPATELTLSAAYFGYATSHVENWEPTVGDMDDVESNLSQISALSAWDPGPYSRIENPREYFRQYVPAVVDGRRVILLNAFCADHGEDWRTHLVVVMDGGKCYWHASYDLAARKFSNLMVNGIG